MENKNNNRIEFRLCPEHMQVLNELAKGSQLSINQIVKIIVEKELNKWK